MEYLDHRQLLAVNFTGVVTNDFPLSNQPGVVAFAGPTPQPGTINQPNVKFAEITGDQLRNLIKVSGFDISGIRVNYDPTSDILSIGLDQPPSLNQPGEVVAGDADNNGNSGTVNPAVLALEPNFQDNPDMQGTEAMAAFLDLNNDGTPDIVAGFNGANQSIPKPYQVATAIPTVPGAAPTFGTFLPDNTGNFFLASSSNPPSFQQAHPNLEMQITNFSKIFQQVTGQALASSSVLSIGGFGGSSNDVGVSESFFPASSFQVGQAITPTPTPTPCPPASPPVLINPHSHRHINTAHPTDIRATVFGTSGFDVTQIVPSTVTLGGAHPVAAFTRHVNRDEWLDETFVFKGTDVKLPPGISEATVSGTLKDGMTFSSSSQIFNRDASFYSPGAVRVGQARQAANPNALATSLATLARKAESTPGTTVVLNTQGQTAAASVRAQAVPEATGPVISIPRRRPTVAGHRAGSHVSPKLQASLNSYLQSADLAAASAT
jgi:hypothetical protein